MLVRSVKNTWGLKEWTITDKLCCLYEQSDRLSSLSLIVGRQLLICIALRVRSNETAFINVKLFTLKKDEHEQKIKREREAFRITNSLISYTLNIRYAFFNVSLDKIYLLTINCLEQSCTVDKLQWKNNKNSYSHHVWLYSFLIISNKTTSLTSWSTAILTSRFKNNLNWNALRCSKLHDLFVNHFAIVLVQNLSLKVFNILFFSVCFTFIVFKNFYIFDFDNMYIFTLHFLDRKFSTVNFFRYFIKRIIFLSEMY